VLAAFGPYQDTPDGWLCHCPCPNHGRHGFDQNPSLRVTIGEEGRILVCCRTGCCVEDVLRAAELRFTDLFPSEGEEPMARLSRDVVRDEPSIEDLELRHEVYSFMLGRLALAEEDRQNLLGRGLSPAAIEKAQYRTLLSSGHDCLLRMMYGEFGDRLLAVPGFRPGPSGTARLTSQAEGILIPCRDDRGWIAALKVRRRDGAGEGPRYYYLSGGEVSSGAPVHYPARPDGFDHARTVLRVTEGELKADVAFDRSGVYTIGLPGVTAWRRALHRICLLVPERVLVAFDWADVQTNFPVYQQWVTFVGGLRDQGLRVAVEIWDDESHKGIDDALAAGEATELVEGEALDKLLVTLGRKHGSTTWPSLSRGFRGFVGSEGFEGYEGFGIRERFPTEVFPQYVRDFLGAVRTAVGCPEEMTIAPVLAAVARATAASWEVRLTHTGVQRPILYAVTIAPSGRGKGPAAEGALLPVRVRDREARAARSTEPGAFPPQVIVADTTAEAMVKALQSNEEYRVGGLLAYPDELTGLVKGMGQYKNGGGNDRQLYLSAWDNKPYSKIRADGSELYIDKPALVLLGNIPPKQLQQIEPRHTEGDGFLPRFLLHYTEDWWHPEVESFEDGLLPDDDRRVVAWHRAVQNLHAVTGPVRLELTSAAKQAWVDGLNSFARLLNDSPLAQDEEIQSFGGKCRVYAARLLIVLHAVDWACGDEFSPRRTPQEVPVESGTVNRAWRLATHYLSTAYRVLQKIRPRRLPARRAEAAEDDTERKALLIMNTILRKKWHESEGFTRRDLHQELKDVKGFELSADLAEPLDLLCSRGELEKLPKPTGPLGGRPTTLYRVTPETPTTSEPSKPSEPLETVCVSTGK
jgi:hypothetical protein